MATTDQKQTVGVFVYLAALVALCVVLGRTAGNMWVGLLCFGGLMALQIVASRAVAGKFSGAWLTAWMGAWAISIAGTTAEYAGRWLWAIPWALAGLLLFVLGSAARGKSKWASTYGFGVSVWSFAWAVVGPLWLYGKDQQQTQQWMQDLARQWWWLALAAFALFFLGALIKVYREVKKERTPSIGAGQQQAPDIAKLLALIAQQERLKNLEAERQRQLEDARLRREEAERRQHVNREPVGRPAPEVPTPAGPMGHTVLAHGATVLAPENPVDGGLIESSPNHGELLYTAPGPVVDAAIAPDGQHYLLLEDGSLARWYRGHLDEVPDVKVSGPMGVVVGGDGRVVVAGRSDGVLDVRFADGGPPDVHRHRVDLSIGSIAINPYGTIAAFAPVRKHDVFALLLDADATQTLATDVGAVTALAFSSDSLALAIGLREGSVSLLNMSTRQITGNLMPPGTGHAAVTALLPGPDGGWIAGYENGLVARWDESANVVAWTKLSHPVRDIALAPSMVAVGCRDGHVVTEPLDLSGILLDLQVAEEIVALAPSDATSLIAASHDGRVRRVAL